ncbi:MAG: hypothetical protein ACN4GM_04425 [Gammaproteobacteria bacterium]
MVLLFQITDTTIDPARLTQSVLQIRDFLDLYNAELARILTVQCADIGRLGVARTYLEVDTIAWQQALLLRSSYQMLYDWQQGDSVAMNHWLRKSHAELKPSPLLLMVDHAGLQKVHDYLSARATG